MLNPPNSPEISHRAWAIFWIGSAGFVLSMFYRLSITVISPELARDLNLNTVQLSQLSAAFFSTPLPSARSPSAWPWILSVPGPS